MPLRLDITRQLIQRTDRVKGVDLHPTEPWLLANLYNGNVCIWNYNDQTLVKSFEVTELPVRTAKFIARKQWMVCGADDMYIRVYSYNTMDKVKAFEAHSDYIRCIAAHPTLPYLLSSSDDMFIKLWDWDKGWQCVQVFEGHSHYVMQVCFNPKDTNTFASASLDRTIKVWNLGQATPNFTLEGHEKGVNCIDYFTGGDRPYLISGADDKLVKIWDYQTKACVQTLEGHSHNIATVAFHPELPLIITGSEDGTVKLWHSTTYRLESTISYSMERVWAVAVLKGSKSLAIGYDEGVVMIKAGRENPVASMDSSGKIIWARHNEIQTVNVKSLGADFEINDGDRLPLAVKDLGSCDLYPQALEHNPNGRFVVVCGDGEYIVYTALAWRNKSFGSALDFVWGADSNEFATRESPSKVKIFKNFAEKAALKFDYAADGIHGGGLLTVRSQDFVVFYSWADGALVRRIDVPAKNVMWSDAGDLLAIISDSSFYILRYNRALVEEVLASGEELADDSGIEDAFELLYEVADTVQTGFWAGDCFVYNNSAWRLNYCVGGEVTTMYHLDRPMYLLGYLAAQSRVYLVDKEFSIISYTLLLSMIEFKTLIMRGEVDSAMEVLATIPAEEHNTAAKFLESRGEVDRALQVATDPDYRFELALQVGSLPTALEIAEQLDSTAKWRQLGELCMQSGQLALALQCMDKAEDLSGLLLMHTSLGNRAGLEALAAKAMAQGKNNVAFVCLHLLQQPKACVQLLADSGRLPEATFFARSYVPSAVDESLQLWKADLQKLNPKAAESLADPAQYPNLFPDFEAALHREQGVTAAPDDDELDEEGELDRELFEDAENNAVAVPASPPKAAAPASPTKAAAPVLPKLGAAAAATTAAAALIPQVPDYPPPSSNFHEADEQLEAEDDFHDPEPLPPAPAPTQTVHGSSPIPFVDDDLAGGDSGAGDLGGLEEVEGVELDDDWGLDDPEDES